MRKGICILVCLVLCWVAFQPAEAENAEDETRKLDQTLARWGLAMTAQMMGNACDRMGSAEADPLKMYYKSFSEIDFLRPYRVLVADLTAEQAAAAQKALAAENQVDIAPALAAYLNEDYPEYSKAVEQILPEAATTSDAACALVLLTYERHIAAVSFDGYYARSALIISMESSSRSLSAWDVGFYAGKIGLTGLEIRMYGEREMSDLLDLHSWNATYSGNSGKLVAALTKNKRRIQCLFPFTLKEDTLSDSFRFYILQSYLEEAMKDDLTGAAKLVSRTLLPMMSDNETDKVDAFMEACRKMIDVFRDERRPPEIAYGEAARPNPEGTYVFVIELHNPERDPESFYDPVLEAALPAANIPETPETADYIIRCKVTYSDEPDISNSSSAVYYPTTDITVHDAHTGDLICSLGSVTNPRPSGLIMVSRGTTYHYPNLELIWEKAKTIFEASFVSAD